ncbi:minor tail protein [Gordonia phage Demosthenes]|uniref:Minor tail protein n=1 Tax=Gordonia phage Demosthenes TaxID=1838067 RepID=A0A166Y6L4_9CAUD|nr:minor tail protein [Gordonia phage Demosthenes]ANA85997.1 minor tail protein [Gordonia phage Demosthenes]
MSRVIHRPNQAVDYGTVNTTGQGNVLGDGNNSTYKDYYEDSGSILLYPTFDPALVPDGRQIIAVRAGHVQRNGGLVGLHNGWVMGYLRVDNARVLKSKAYKQDGYSLGARTIEGEPIYKGVDVPWDAADINRMTTDIGAATGTIAPNKRNFWCIGAESYIVVVIDDDVPIPTISYPANNQVIDTSSVDFQAVAVPSQPEQPVAAVFQVSRVNTFDDDTVDTFVGGLNASMTAGSKSIYDSVIGKDSYTNLGPGKWYVRVKGMDYREVQSDWGPTTSFTITHTALLTPTLFNPASGSTKATPYGLRQASFATNPTGERYVGAQWQFCQNNDFATGPVVSWTNNKEGRYNLGLVGYTSDPDPTIEPGLNGSKVSTDDPDQYLKQGTWFGRVRAVDVWGQTGPWSASHSFTVSHPPTVQDVWPSGGKAFDDDAFPVRWKFGDAWVGDAQTAFQVIVRDGSNNVIHDTGKVSSGFNTRKVVIPDTFLEQTLNLAIKLWDKDDVESPWWTGTFRLAKAPVITLNYPAPDEVVITGQPILSWSSVFSSGANQKSYHIAFINRATKTVEYKTSIIASAATTWNAPTVVLKNLQNYQLALTITDTNDLYTTLLRNFSTDYVRPPTIQCEAFVNTYEDEGYIDIMWPDVLVDPLFVEYRLYRKRVDIDFQDWEQIGTVTDPNVFEFHDWSTSGEAVYKFGITQVVMLYGALVESLPDENGAHLAVRGSHYWLIIPDHEELNTKVYNVTGDKSTRRVEMSQHVIIEGGGSRVNYGKPIGIEGSMTAQIRGGSLYSAREFSLRLERIQFERGYCFLRDPFGNYTRIALGEIGESRVPGVGTNEYKDLEIPYIQVAAPPDEGGYAG